MEKRVFKEKIYAILAKLIKAMANPHRLEIIDLLGQGERSVEEIAKQTNISIANASQHLQVLKTVNLVDIRREGNFVNYRLAGEGIYQAWQNIRELGIERVAEIEKVIREFRKNTNTLEALKIDDLLNRLKSGKIMLLDIRPVEEYNNGHIPSAINIPIEELSSKLKDLSRN